MQILKYVFLILLCSFCISLNSKGSDLCTTASIDELIKYKYSSNNDIKNIWSELKEKGVVKRKDSEAYVRPAMVNIQFLFESALATSLKNGDIKQAKGVIYTPLPPTPLSANEHNLNTLAIKFTPSPPEKMQSIINRTTSVREYLLSGGTLYTIYNKASINAPGSDIYKNNLRRYPNQLIDTPVEKINTRYTGASYIAECNNGTKIFFSIKGRQAIDTKPKQWVIYYGTSSDFKYFEKVSAVYNKSAGVKFDF